jgi:hypothetical protein
MSMASMYPSRRKRGSSSDAAQRAEYLEMLRWLFEDEEPSEEEEPSAAVDDSCVVTNALEDRDHEPTTTEKG